MKARGFLFFMPLLRGKHTTLFAATELDFTEIVRYLRSVKERTLMTTFVITKTERYEVEADDPRVALNHFHIFYGNADQADLVGMVILKHDQEDFEYVDGKATIEQKEY